MYLVFHFSVILWVAGLGGAAPTKSIRERQVDLIELNHFLDDDGREVFRQVIFYDWSPAAGRYHVRGWRLIKHDRQLPQRRWRPTGYVCSWTDDGEIRQVWSDLLRETWSHEDPERVNRRHLPEGQRIPLFD